MNNETLYIGNVLKNFYPINMDESVISILDDSLNHPRNQQMSRDRISSPRNRGNG
jgi:hypothetical protein